MSVGNNPTWSCSGCWHVILRCVSVARHAQNGLPLAILTEVTLLVWSCTSTVGESPATATLLNQSIFLGPGRSSLFMLQGGRRGEQAPGLLSTSVDEWEDVQAPGPVPTSATQMRLSENGGCVPPAMSGAAPTISHRRAMTSLVGAPVDPPLLHWVETPIQAKIEVLILPPLLNFQIPYGIASSWWRPR